MAHPNEELMRKGYDAFARGDLETLQELLADDVVWHVGGDNPLTGDYRGQQEVLALFGKLFEMTGGTLKQDVHDMLANDEHGVALVTLTAQRNGKSLESRSAHVSHISGGKLTEFWLFAEDQAAVDEFWS